MTAELGAFALVLALAMSLAQVGLSAVGRVRRDATLRGAGEGAALAACVAMAVAFAALMTAFVSSDFSVANVQANSNTDQPLFYRITATWGSHEGSMLLWNLALTGMGGAIALFGRNLPAGLKASALACQGALGVLFIGYTAFASNPFLRLPFAPIEGQSLNPILQDPFMAIHPPFLYSGYVGFSVVFSLAVAALVEGRADAAWARWIRPWALAAWSLLTIGITLGSFWAYYELGWGGWWFWDPVENASFMPWLVGAALIHSAVVTEKRGALTGWTVFLALAAFSFSMLGAFLVRSGVLTSVHAFAVDPARGVLLLIILGVAAGSGFALFAWRAPGLPPGGLFAAVSRESALVLNNLFLATAAATVALGTLYPLARQALTGEAISVGAPYFALTFRPLMGLCLLVLPVGPFLAWKRGELTGALRKLWLAAVAAVAAGLVGLLVVSPRNGFAALGLALGAWLIAGALSEIAARVQVGQARPAELARRLRRLPLGAWGMTLAHAGLGVFVLGASTELAWRVEAAQSLNVGRSLASGGYTLTLEGVSPIQGPNFTAERATIRVQPPRGAAFTVAPERRLYPARRQTTSKVAIRRQGTSDLYVVLGEGGEVGGRPAWLVRVFYNPWARLIFFGPVLMALGGAVSLADRRLRLAVGRRATVGSAVAADAGLAT